jgi:hypothetical protein
LKLHPIKEIRGVVRKYNELHASYLIDLFEQSLHLVIPGASLSTTKYNAATKKMDSVIDKLNYCFVTLGILCVYGYFSL